MRANQRHSRAGRQRGIALVIVLSFVVLLTVAVVAYFSRTISERQVANDSYNAGRTDQLARSALDVIVSDFKQEIANGSYPTTVNGVTTYYPSSADGTTLLRANMLPQRSGNPGTPPFTSSNPDPIPNLVRRSVANDTMASPGVASRASPVNSYTNASVNGRLVSLARWNKHFLIPQKDATGSKPDPVASFNAPDWVMMTQEEGPVVLQSPTKDASGNTVTVTGRYAYAVYDEGGLLDANVAGFPSGATPAQLGYKSSLGMADLPTALAAATPAVTLSATSAVDKLVGWRNYATAQPSGIFPASTFASNFAASSAPATLYFNALQTNYSGFMRTSNAYWNNSTDQAFLSRQQLLGFQQTLQQTSPGSFPASALQYLGTFSRELNAPSWGPTQNATDMGSASNSAVNSYDNRSVAYNSNRNNDTAPNRYLPNVRFTKAGTVTDYDASSNAYQYMVSAGAPLMQRRFLLGRLTWVGPKGPRNGGTAQSIQACFGLVWGPATDAKLLAANPTVTPFVWKYCGATGSTESGAIETLAQVASEMREPNFFELLQAGILSGSLAFLPSDASPVFNLVSDGWPVMQVLRIGASIITQSQQPDTTVTMNYPTVIEYAQAGLPMLAVGTDDLPYLNTLSVVSGAATGTQTPIQVYILPGLWNPQQTVGTASRPNVRFCLEGSVSMLNRYGNYSAAAVTIYNFSSPGYTYFLDSSKARLPLSSSGVNGFTDPHIVTPQDVQSSLSAGASGLDWGQTTILGTQYVGYRLPDFNLDLTKHPGPKYPLNASGQTTDPNSALWSEMYFYFNVDKYGNPFNAWLEFQNPDGAWIPYTYFGGVNHQDPALAKQPGLYTSYMGDDGLSSASVPVGGYSTASPQPLPIDPPAGSNALYYYKIPLVNTDPRSLRFNYGAMKPYTSRPGDFTFVNSSIWSSQTEGQSPSSSWWGRSAFQWGLTVPWGISNGPFDGCNLCRNNTSVPYTYSDPDGILRIADSGLYTNNASTNGWQGDPYAVSTTTTIDRPTVFHRPYANVAELGYISRDYPWRTLDFFTTTSADAGLLDLFTAGANAGRLSAGRINLNSRNVSALTAMLSRAGTNFVPSPPTTLTKPTAIAAKLVALTTSSTGTDGPLFNKSELVTRFVGAKLSTGTTVGSDFMTLDEQNIKTHREAVTRSLAEVGQTRTWNLLVDVVAQSGRYSTNATQLGQFNVEGERHYWLHVAIDRFTGEVIDQQLEAVSE